MANFVFPPIKNKPLLPLDNSNVLINATSGYWNIYGSYFGLTFSTVIALYQTETKPVRSILFMHVFKKIVTRFKNKKKYQIENPVHVFCCP